jgi:starch synthase
MYMNVFRTIKDIFMHVVHITTEFAPVAKVGGLADVIYGLCKETSKYKHKVEIIIPKYDCIDFGRLKNLKVENRELCSFEGPNRYNNTIWSAEVENLRVILIEPHHPNFYFSRGVIYGCPDDSDRFAYFSRAALEYLYKSDKWPDVLHIHDWPTSLAALLYKEMYIPLGMRIGGILLTIHNLEHQGRCSVNILNQAGLRGEDYLVPEKMQDSADPELINLLKGGIEYSDIVNTVSPTYLKEIQTPSGGFDLSDTLRRNQKKLTAILNGVDETFWNPQTDPHLVAHYSTRFVNAPEEFAKVLKAKADNKRQLRMHFGLKEDKTPIVGSVTRLVPQKGPDLIKHGLRRTLEKGGQFILLGSCASEEQEKSFLELQNGLAKNKNTAICLDQNEALAHLIFAGADMFIIPSIFEPCGLTQLIALRYGTVPIARMTGGLADTVFDVDSSERPENERNGFTFEHPDPKEMDCALDRAIDCWFKDQKKWQSIMQQGMNMDFSWTHEALKYLEIYKSLSKSI